MIGKINNTPFPLRRMVWLRLHLSNLCNFACPGCHVFKISPNDIAQTNMSLEIAEKAILFFSELMSQYYPGEKWVYLSIYGGEPLLNRPVLYELLKKYGQSYKGINLHWVVNTNGSLLNSEDLERFRPNQVDIHMSVDGREEKHNRARVDKLGRGTFSRVKQAIDLINQREYPFLQFDSVAIPYELESVNEVLDVAKEYGVNRVHLDFFYNQNYPYNYSPEKYGKTYAHACMYGRNQGVSVFESNFFNLYSNYFNNNDISQRPHASAFPFMHFYADGSFSFNELPLNKPFGLISDLGKEKIDSVWQKRINLLREMDEEFAQKCAGCFLYKYCKGNTRRIYRYHTLSNQSEDQICVAQRTAVKELAENNYIP